MQERGSSIYVVQQAQDWRLEWFDGRKVKIEVFADLNLLAERIKVLVAWDVTFRQD